MAGKTNKRLRLKEIREVCPVADVYELHPNCRYIVFVKKSRIMLDQNVDAMDAGQQIMRIMAAHKIPCAIFIGSLDDIRIVELTGEKV